MAIQHNGRCHWGQYFSPNLDHEYLVNAYSEKSVNSFITQLKKFDPNGRMGNELTKKLGLTPDGIIHSEANSDFSSIIHKENTEEEGRGIRMFKRIKSFTKLRRSIIIA